MKDAERLKCLQADVDKLVDRFSRDRDRHKSTALTLKLTSVFLAAIITILLGLKFQSVALKDVLSNIALVLGAIITVLGAYEAFFDPRALWVRETVTFARLKDLQRDLRYWASGFDVEGTDSTEALNQFKLRLDRVLDGSLKYWIKLKGAPDIERETHERVEAAQTLRQPV